MRQEKKLPEFGCLQKRHTLTLSDLEEASQTGLPVHCFLHPEIILKFFI